ncbi:MAG: hypothetical protein JNM59_01300 [Hyphomonadaceae bacterium]|nr:hypothetical protein [Hyphomonadaceae bacterium]
MDAMAVDRNEFAGACEIQQAPRLPSGEFDFCSREGAQVLKQKIEAYWRERGQNVTILLHNVGFHPAIRAARYDVRSDMVNGLPRAGKPRAPGNPANQYAEG